ncbi:MAG: histidine kinase dimerization/phospho-acceptor domain-containing protein [Elainellaceae cyanobacterium]
MHRWYLPTLSEIIASTEPSTAYDLNQASRHWYASVTALSELLNQVIEGRTTIQADSLLPQEGVILSGPLPVFHEGPLMPRFSDWAFAGSWTTSLRRQLPSKAMGTHCQPSNSISLLAGDPLASESFYLVLTAEFGLVATLSDAPSDGRPAVQHPAVQQAFNFSFDPEVVSQCWQALRTRVKLTNPKALAHLDPLIQQFTPRAPEYQLVTTFSRRLLASLGATATSQTPRTVEQVGKPRRPAASAKTNLNLVDDIDDPRGAPVIDVTPVASAAEPGDNLSPQAGSDTELLKAIAHEVRTPLTTIRTLTRLLLRRRDLPAPATKRLAMIDRECTRQIERFGLIFRAVELETDRSRNTSPLAKISLEELFRKNLDRWKQQAEERGLTLDVGWANALPTVLSDPAMLDQMLTGLIDRVTHALPAGSHIQMRVIPAGNQLKLQLYSRSTEAAAPHDSSWTTNPLSSLFSPSLSLKSIGQLLMFQPETGNLSLNLDSTKNMFQSLGGKFTIRHHPQQGEVVTIFLPLEQAEAS